MGRCHRRSEAAALHAQRYTTNILELHPPTVSGLVTADPVLDLDWQSNSTLATCSTDQLVLVWEVGSNVPIKTFSGHKVVPHMISCDFDHVILHVRRME